MKWTFEPGHSAAEFRARHMMVTWVRGHFKNVEGVVEFDPARPEAGRVEATLDAAQLWTGEPGRDAHLRSPDFLDVERYPRIQFVSTRTEQVGCYQHRITGNLSLRGVTREVVLDATFLGQWSTPYWEGDRDLGPRQRAGFEARTVLNRHDFGVSWNATMDRGGLVVGDQIYITLDVEAILET